MNICSKISTFTKYKERYHQTPEQDTSMSNSLTYECL